MSNYISIQEVIDRLSEVLSSEEEFEKAKQVIIEAPTLDEKEIIRKPFERVVERLDKQAGEFIDLSHRELSNNSITAKKYLNKGFGVARAIEIVKEVGGFNG